jgi:hypothetical protein
MAQQKIPPIFSDERDFYFQQNCFAATFFGETPEDENG